LKGAGDRGWKAPPGANELLFLAGNDHDWKRTGDAGDDRCWKGADDDSGWKGTDDDCAWKGAGDRGWKPPRENCSPPPAPAASVTPPHWRPKIQVNGR
jgi:hypothetical protein